MDYWLYNLKHMEKLESLEFKGQKALFQRLEELARIVNMNKKERDEYEACLKVYRDNYNTWNYMKEQALKEGKEEGLAEGLAEGIEKGQKKEKINNARRMLEKGYPIEDIAEITELTEEEIKNILK
ncbi:MAG: PD-(D/E)XK nuclease family transposase [Parabacteroides sp.]|nr:PD-(D/E)XK nuclease family transposase [Parabacteroides sp.]